VLMLTVLTGSAGVAGADAGVIFELESLRDTGQLLRAGGWTTLTAVCVMLFSLVHNPCSTTLYTIYRETGSARWTAVSALLPVILGVALCAAIAWVWGGM
jgi:ferrous iron transport protein B